MKLVLIVGSPRSGTTWLQKMLASHSAFSTTQETYLFSGYLNSLNKYWEKEINRNDNRGVGITHLIDRSDFIELNKTFALSVLKKIKKTSKSEFIIEKTPNNALVLDFIIEMFPNVHVIHLVRDPRSVAASLISASKGWGETLGTQQLD
tara:strand:+ start:7784 stop:8230 length:447 start_codon:yes stop_codon:yes gene_type:complete